jgi:hypothetical protein
MKNIYFILVLTILSACGSNGSAPFNSSMIRASSGQYLYVVSGTCYGGGVATSAGPANTVVKYNLADGSFKSLVVDYNQLSPGDSPVAIADYDSNRLLVLVENASGRRIDLVQKDGSAVLTYLTNSAVFATVMRSFVLLSDFSILISKTTAVEKFNSGKSRVLSGVNPYVNAPAGSCATSTTLISSVVAHSSGKIIYTHAAASPNNLIGVINSTGYNVAADCNSGTAAPTALALPTRAIFHPNGKLLVSFGSITAANNYIYSYDFNGATGAITNPVAVFNDGGTIVNGPSSMAVDINSNDVFVTNVTSSFNTIERFHFVNNSLSRTTSQTFIPYGAYTRCISDMRVMN